MNRKSDKPMKWNRKWRAYGISGPKRVALLSGAAIVLFLFASCGKQEEVVEKEVVRPVKVFHVSAAGDMSGIELPGKVRASQRVDLAFKEVGGRLIELPIAGREGQRVQKGELLARIDPTDFRVSLEHAKGQLKAAAAAVELAESEYKRVLRIREQDPGAVSASMVDRRRETLNQARAQVQSLKAIVADARNKLQYTRLLAPFAGVIARRYVDNFEEVKPKQPIVSLQNVDFIEILVDVPENLMAIRKKGGDALRVFTEFPTAPGKRFKLQFKERAGDADPATQTYQVTFLMKQPEGINVLPGMTTKVIAAAAETGRPANREIRIPAIAVVTDPVGKNYVWVLDTEKMTVHRQDVVIGPPTGSEDIIVTGGLQGDETIVTAGVLKLKEGQKVLIWEE